MSKDKGDFDSRKVCVRTAAYLTAKQPNLIRIVRNMPISSKNFITAPFRSNDKPQAMLLLSIALIMSLFVASGCAKKIPAEDSLTAAPLKPALEGVTSDGLLINEGLAEKVLLTAYSQLGVPYRYGGTNPSLGFDCSGFTSWVYSQNGIQLPRSSKEQFQVGLPVAQKDLKPGDLVMYKRGRSRGTHIGIYAGNGMYIHSPSKGKTVMEADAFNPGSNLKYLGARRMFEDPASCPLTQEQKENAKQIFNASDKADIKVVFKPGKKPKLLSENLQIIHPAHSKGRQKLQ